MDRIESMAVYTRGRPVRLCPVTIASELARRSKIGSQVRKPATTRQRPSRSTSDSILQFPRCSTRPPRQPDSFLVAVLEALDGLLRFRSLHPHQLLPCDPRSIHPERKRFHDTPDLATAVESPHRGQGRRETGNFVTLESAEKDP